MPIVINLGQAPGGCKHEMNYPRTVGSSGVEEKGMTSLGTASQHNLDACCSVALAHTTARNPQVCHTVSLHVTSCVTSIMDDIPSQRGSIDVAGIGTMSAGSKRLVTLPLLHPIILWFAAAF